MNNLKNKIKLIAADKDPYREDGKNKTIIIDEAIGYGCHYYSIWSNSQKLTPEEIVQVIDPNNFGYSVSGGYLKIYVD